MFIILHRNSDRPKMLKSAMNIDFLSIFKPTFLQKNRLDFFRQIFDRRFSFVKKITINLPTVILALDNPNKFKSAFRIAFTWFSNIRFPITNVSISSSKSSILISCVRRHHRFNLLHVTLRSPIMPKVPKGFYFPRYSNSIFTITSGWIKSTRVQSPPRYIPHSSGQLKWTITNILLALESSRTEDAKVCYEYWLSIFLRLISRHICRFYYTHQSLSQQFYAF